MPGFILHAGATVQCSHGGQAQPMTTDPRVTVSGQPIVVLSSIYQVSGCPITPPPYAPCVTAQWLSGATRVFAGGQPVIVLGSQSLAVPPPQPLVILSTQTRVSAT